MADYQIDAYVRQTQPSRAESLPDYMARELQKVQRSLESLRRGCSEVRTSAPERPQEGMLAYAKAPWNPGSGDGLYVYKSTGWTFIA